jgi:hypothetical protein
LVTSQGIDKAALVKEVKQALYASKICSYAQGLNIIKAKSEEKQWGIDMGGLSRIWKVRATPLIWRFLLGNPPTLLTVPCTSCSTVWVLVHAKVSPWLSKPGLTCLSTAVWGLLRCSSLPLGDS